MRKFKDDRNRAYNDITTFGTSRDEGLAGDINVSVMYPGTIKAFHKHEKQDDYWFIAKGNARAVLIEEDEFGQFDDLWTNHDFSSIEENGYRRTIHYLSEGDCLFIPSLVWHGIQVLGQEETILVYYITNHYNESVPDEIRAPYDQFFDWNITKK